MEYGFFSRIGFQGTAFFLGLVTLYGMIKGDVNKAISFLIASVLFFLLSYLFEE